MSQRPRVLFLLFEALLDTVIYSQVLDHVRELAKAGIAEFEVWALPCDQRGYAHSVENLERAQLRAGCSIRVFRGVRPASLASVQRNVSLIQQALRSNDRRFDKIHARGDYAALVAAELARTFGFSVLWDCRGDAAAELEYRPDLMSLGGKLIAPALRYLLKARMRKAARLCDQALFVSNPLRDSIIGSLGKKPHAVIPCCADEQQFFFDKNLRDLMRSKLGYSPDDIVFAYTGTLHRYQRFDETVAAFSRYHAVDARARLLVVTPHREEAMHALSPLPQDVWQLVTVRFDEVNGLLNAADAGFLLREATPTNRVASPTKFAEYCLTGLPVIMSDAVPDSYRLAIDAGNLVPFDESSGEAGRIPEIDRAAISEAYRNVVSKRSHLPAYRTIYAAQLDGGMSCAG